MTREEEELARAIIEASARYGSDGKGTGGLAGFFEKYPGKIAALRKAGLLPPEPWQLPVYTAGPPARPPGMVTPGPAKPVRPGWVYQ